MTELIQDLKNELKEGNIYYNENLVFYIEENLTKNELLEKMVHSIIEKTNIIEEENDFFNNILEREKIGGTGIGMGIALPHARFNGAKGIVMAIALLKNGVDFSAPDQENAKLVILIGAPKEMGKDYLNLLSVVARAFRNKKYREDVISSSNVEELKKALKEFK